MGVLLIIAGLVAIIGGIFGKDFYVADVLSLSEFKPKQKSSTWSGRMVFIAAGGFLVAVGVKLLNDAR
jgi:hypothetical protein